MSQLNRFKLFGTTPSHSESILPKFFHILLISRPKTKVVAQLIAT